MGKIAWEKEWQIWNLKWGWNFFWNSFPIQNKEMN